MTARASLVLVLFPVLITRPLQGQSMSARQLDSARAAMLRAEDARGGGPAGVDPLIRGLRVPALREQAIRAIGRLERPDLIPHLVPFVLQPATRMVAADALAQALRGTPDAGSAGRASRVDTVFEVLRAQLASERRAEVVGALARSIGRLPYGDARQARAAETVLLSVGRPGSGTGDVPARTGVAHALYSLARARRTLGDLSPEALGWLRDAAAAGPVRETAPLRRLAWLALTAAGTVPTSLYDASREDPDAQVRRLEVASLPGTADTAVRRRALDRASRDIDPMVRLEWARVYRQLLASTDCGPLVVATRDHAAAVRLAAIDALGGPCPVRDSTVAVLRRFIDAGPAGPSRRAPAQSSWHERAHALVALARVDAAAARPLLHRDSRHPVWQVRLYVARGAAALRDTTLLTTLAFDSIGNVREVALQGLAGTVGHVADLVYARALASPDYHVVLAAARALKGTPARDSILPAVLVALERLSRERRQTSRDPRMELLARVEEMADTAATDRLAALLNDVDTAFSRRVLRLVSRLDPRGHPAAIAAILEEPGPAPAAPVRVRVTMSSATGGGTFDFVMDAAEAPLTVGRVARLIRQGYYDGLTWHRVVPNFVIQGGSPAMNEYVGDGPFMRDELGLAHHARGTLGISTRGRDTGDAQWFINLVDNYRLDHDYTVFARVVDGMSVVDGIMEGDVMESVRIVAGPPVR